MLGMKDDTCDGPTLGFLEGDAVGEMDAEGPADGIRDGAAEGIAEGDVEYNLRILLSPESAT